MYIQPSVIRTWLIRDYYYREFVWIQGTIHVDSLGIVIISFQSVHTIAISMKSVKLPSEIWLLTVNQLRIVKYCPTICGKESIQCKYMCTYNTDYLN